MHTLTDDVVRWVNRIFLGREWQWPVQPLAEADLLPSTDSSRELARVE
jgi:hypothetical protein